MRDLMDKKVEASLLYGYYGALLTDNQARMLKLYCDEDYSLTEIAGQFGVSRQSVYDTLNRSMQLLLQTEEKLHLAARAEARAARLTEALGLIRSLPVQAEGEDARGKAGLIIEKLLSEEDDYGV